MLEHRTWLSWIKLLGNGLQTVPCGQQVTRNILVMTTNTKRASTSRAFRDMLLVPTLFGVMDDHKNISW